jgi:hypothetical protein
VGDRKADRREKVKAAAFSVIIDVGCSDGLMQVMLACAEFLEIL